MNPLPLALLKTACIAAFLIGLAAAAAAYPPLAGPWNLFLDLGKWPLDGTQSAASSEARILSAIGGGLTCGLMVILYGLVSGPIARGNREVRGLYVKGVLTWFCIDSTASFAAGWPGNVALNILFAVMLLGPFLLDRPAPARPAAA